MCLVQINTCMDKEENKGSTIMILRIAAAVDKKGTSQDKVISSSEEIKPVPFALLSYAWLKASVSQLVKIQ